MAEEKQHDVKLEVTSFLDGRGRAWGEEEDVEFGYQKKDKHTRKKTTLHLEGAVGLNLSLAVGTLEVYFNITPSGHHNWMIRTDHGYQQGQYHERSNRQQIERALGRPSFDDMDQQVACRGSGAAIPGGLRDTDSHAICSGCDSLWSSALDRIPFHEYVGAAPMNPG